MTVHIALLRAVNVGKTGKVSMAALRQVAADLGLDHSATLLRSGNLVFASDRDETPLQTMLEGETARRLGVATDFILRTAAQWDAVIAANPFTAEAKADPGHLVVIALKAPAAAGWLDELTAWNKGPERIEARGREVYIVYPDGIGRSKLTNKFIESRLDTRGTGRNWNTVLKLRDLAKAIPIR